MPRNSPNLYSGLSFDFGLSEILDSSDASHKNISENNPQSNANDIIQWISSLKNGCHHNDEYEYQILGRWYPIQHNPFIWTVINILM